MLFFRKTSVFFRKSLDVIRKNKINVEAFSYKSFMMTEAKKILTTPLEFTKNESLYKIIVFQNAKKKLLRS